jgi:large subunit ribosomal protein L9
VADALRALTLTFAVKAGETGKLYGSVTSAQIADEIKRASGLEVDRRVVGQQPLRELGEYQVPVRLTTDLIPSVKVIIHREGEASKMKAALAAAAAAARAEAGAAPAAPAEAPEAGDAEAALAEASGADAGDAEAALAAAE